MSFSGAQIAVQSLKQEGVRWLIGIPGTHNIELYDAILECPEITPVLVTDEQSAAFMADGIFRASGELAAVNLVPGAGLTHALSGIAECYLDQIPLLVLLCGIRNDSEFAYQLHEIDQVAVVKPLCKRVYRPANAVEIAGTIREACALARMSPGGPVVVEVPANVYLQRVSSGEGLPAEMGNSPQVSMELWEAKLAEAADQLNQSSSIGIYVGLGAQEAGPQLLALAEALDALVLTTISGKGVFPETNKRWVWSGLGRALPAPLRKIEGQLDCLLAIGCRFGEVATGSYGYSVPKRLVHVDIDPGVLGKNVTPSCAIVSDAKHFIQTIQAPGRLKIRSADHERLDRLAAAHANVDRDTREWERVKKTRGVSPGALFRNVQAVCGADTVFVADSGNGLFLAMEHLRLSSPRSFLAPVDYSSMGYSIPAAIGAKLGAPYRPVAVFPGDGAFLMTGLELATAAMYECGLMVFLLRDQELSQIAQFQSAAMGRKSCTQVAQYRPRAIAEAVGAVYFPLESDGDIVDVTSAALEVAKSGKIAFVEVGIDYSHPTYFSRGAVKTNFLRLPWLDRIRMVSRVLARKLGRG